MRVAGFGLVGYDEAVQAAGLEEFVVHAVEESVCSVQLVS